MNSSPEFIQLLRDQCPHDESLHSTLLRMLWAYDPHAKPIGVIGSSGNWIDRPFIQKEYEHIFYNYPDHVLLEIIDVDLSVNGKGNQIFDSPVSYTSEIKPTFFSGRRTRGRAPSNLDIRYCRFCIEEGIKKVGYGYFRHFWSFSDKCLIHGQTLEKLPDLHFNKSLKAIKKLLRGEELKHSLTVTGAHFTPTRSRTLTRRQSWAALNKYFFPIKLAPGCLMSEFVYWIGENCSEFQNPDLKKLAWETFFNYFLLHREIHRFIFREDLAIVFMMCSSFEPEKLDKFFADNVTLIWLDLGPRKQGRLKEVFGKNKAISCVTCNKLSCHLHGTKEFSVVDPQKLSLQYLCENSYTLSRIVMQNRPIVSFGDSVWSVLDVMPDHPEKQKTTSHQVILGDNRE